MAKKTKQRRKPAPPRRPAPARDAPAAGGQAQLDRGPSPAGADAAPARRGVERVDPAGRRAQAARSAKADAGFAPLDAEDPAIPFDRVPYVPRDLRRVAMMAAVMVVLIVVANLIISKVAG